MKANPTKTSTTLDRLATADEIRAALPSPDPFEECAEQILLEIATDVGGYARIPASDLEVSLMIKQLTQEEEKWLN